MPEIRDCVVLSGPELIPRACTRFAWAGDTLTALDVGAEIRAINGGTRVIIPGLINGHTHVGDGALPDGATGLTLEQAFFRPDGYKYRELARLDPTEHQPHIEAHLRFMARSGTVGHVDFREQGAPGARLLRAAAAATGVHSIILSQFNTPPFDAIALAGNTAPLPAAAAAELDDILAAADGFSESTMNDLTDPAWSEIRARTQARGRLRAIHCLENAGYRDLSRQRTGRGDLQQALERFDPHLIVHLTVANADEIAALARSGKPAALNPRANAVLGLPLPPVAALLRAGIPLLLGTDNAMLNSPNLFAEMDFTWKLARSQSADPQFPDPAAILAMTTRNAAALLGADYPGTLTRGGPATFAVIDFTAPQLAHSRHVVASLVGRVTPADVLLTVRHGRTLWTAPGYVG